MATATIKQILDFPFTNDAVKFACNELIDAGLVTENTAIEDDRDFVKSMCLKNDRVLWDSIKSACSGVPIRDDFEQLFTLKTGILPPDFETANGFSFSALDMIYNAYQFGYDDMEVFIHKWDAWAHGGHGGCHVDIRARGHYTALSSNIMASTTAAENLSVYLRKYIDVIKN